MANDGSADGRKSVSTIKLFSFIQKTYHDTGINPPTCNQNRSSINSKNWIILCCLTLILLPSTAYLLLEANSLIEYGMAFFICVTVIGLFIVYLIPLWESKTIFNFIENSEQFIEKSEFTAVQV